ncbi:MAG: hypothetical protein J3K34DRAFT_518151 [Monoraphidium minutum]|nr:MAG: hypothetical protein J3K34DRAFT_518151 [Monoraphidium minutum]
MLNAWLMRWGECPTQQASSAWRRPHIFPRPQLAQGAAAAHAPAAGARPQPFLITAAPRRRPHGPPTSPGGALVPPRAGSLCAGGRAPWPRFVVRLRLRRGTRLTHTGAPTEGASCDARRAVGRNAPPTRRRQAPPAPRAQPLLTRRPPAPRRGGAAVGAPARGECPGGCDSLLECPRPCSFITVRAKPRPRAAAAPRAAGAPRAQAAARPEAAAAP